MIHLENVITRKKKFKRNKTILQQREQIPKKQPTAVTTKYERVSKPPDYYYWFLDVYTRLNSIDSLIQILLNF